MTEINHPLPAYAKDVDCLSDKHLSIFPNYECKNNIKIENTFFFQTK